MVAIKTISTSPFEGQKPGTSGLRKRVKVFQQENYTENFIQSTLEAIPESDGGAKGATLVVGGDGRYYSDQVLQVIVKCSLGQGVSYFCLSFETHYFGFFLFTLILLGLQIDRRS
jgi:phosphoglucomutase